MPPEWAFRWSAPATIPQAIKTVKFVWLREPLPSNMPFSAEKIITVGKPDAKIIAYALDGIPDVRKENVLIIGDNIATDIKGANLLGVSSALISKGVHVNFLGEGYIPDVAKTRELATNFDAYPDFVISNLRW